MVVSPISFASESPEATRELAAQVLAACQDYRIIALYGDLGVGKTTLTQALCEALGVEDNVKSPTFSIINEYDSPIGPVYHFDFYRLEEVEEALDIGFEEYLDSGNWCFMEWPERIEPLLPEETVNLWIENTGESSRKITIELPDVQ